MARFDYLDSSKKRRKAKKRAESPEQSTVGEPAEVVYVRRETIRAAWREYRKDGGESLSELIDDLLLNWLKERT